MTTINPRIQVMLDQETNNLLSNIANEQNQSISLTAANLIKEALELREDILLSRHGDKRFNKSRKWVNHQDAWK